MENILKKTLSDCLTVTTTVFVIPGKTFPSTRASQKLILMQSSFNSRNIFASLHDKSFQYKQLLNTTTLQTKIKLAKNAPFFFHISSVSYYFKFHTRRFCIVVDMLYIVYARICCVQAHLENDFWDIVA